MFAASDRAFKIYAAMASLGDWRNFTYRHGNERLAAKLGCSVDTVERGIAELLALGALTTKRRPGTSNIVRLCKPDEPRPTPAMLAATSTGDTRNARRGTRERVEDWTGHRLAQYFEDAWDRSPWLHRELPAVAKFGTRASVVRYLDREYGPNGLGPQGCKAEIDIFCAHPEMFVEPTGKTTGWTRFQDVALDVLDELKAAEANGSYDGVIGAWSANVENHSFEFGPPAVRHQWPASRDVEPYAWYHASPVDPSTSLSAKVLSRWTNGDLADHVAGVARASGAQIEERAVRALQEYLRLNRPDAVANYEVLGIFDYTWAVVQSQTSVEELIDLQRFMTDPSHYSDPQQRMRRLGWVRYGLDPKLVIGQSPTTQRLQES